MPRGLGVRSKSPNSKGTFRLCTVLIDAQSNERIACCLRLRAGHWQQQQAGIERLCSLVEKVAMLVTTLRMLVRLLLLLMLLMLRLRSQALLASRTMTGVRSRRRNWSIR